jgi:hypothetical protein
VGDEVIFSKKNSNRFPDPEEIIARINNRRP